MQNCVSITGPAGAIRSYSSNRAIISYLHAAFMPSTFSVARTCCNHAQNPCPGVSQAFLGPLLGSQVTGQPLLGGSRSDRNPTRYCSPTPAPHKAAPSSRSHAICVAAEASDGPPDEAGPDVAPAGGSPQTLPTGFDISHQRITRVLHIQMKIITCLP